MLAEKKAEQKENIEQQKARIHAYFEYLKEYGESTTPKVDPKLLDQAKSEIINSYISGDSYH